MVGRKGNSSNVSPLLLVLVALAVFFVTYNVLTILMRHKWSDSEEISDSLIRMPKDTAENLDVKYHVALTATDAPYSQWQSRIMYYWYKKMKDAPGSDMGKFTRILHSGKPDNLMEEIPSFVVDPLPEGLDRVRYIFQLSSKLILSYCPYLLQ